MSKEKIINDSSLGIIAFPDYIQCIIDTKEFQRLRWINQVGLCSFVYPSATQTRFIHSIGTYSLASKLIGIIRSQLTNEPGLVISDKDVKCVEIAALCHDLGHGPFSHFWEILTKCIPPNNEQRDTSHEARFKDIWPRIYENERVKRILLENDIKKAEFLLVERLINGDYIEGDNEILFHVVNNKESALDVDKLEYLCRDVRAFGQKSTNFIIEVERLFRFAKPLRDDKGKWKIAYRASEKDNLVEIFKLRHYNFKRGYCHKTVQAIELMLLDGFKRLVDENKLDRNDLSDTDWILQQNDNKLLSDYQDCDEFKRVVERRLYRLVFHMSKDELLSEDEEKDVRRTLEALCVNKRFIIKFCRFKLGVVREKDGTYKNPLTKIPLYTNDSETCYFMDPLPKYLNPNLDETLVRIFSVKIDDKIDEDLIAKLNDYCTNENWFTL